MSLFNNKYRIESTRLQHWDYKWAAAYFITICTKNRMHYFGEIENKKMILNEIGKTTETEWLKTPDIRPDINIELGEFVVMPNHFHAILIIGENEYNGGVTITNTITKYILNNPLTWSENKFLQPLSKTPNKI